MTDAELAAARRLLDGVRRITVLTGAGMSAESGIPTFREAQTGLWAKFDPQRLASPEGFRADPALVWRWYASRRQGVVIAQPNAGHLTLAQAAGAFDSLRIVTQNVDGLHQRAGSREVIELHGNILRSRCFADCGTGFPSPQALPPGEPPRCPNCGEFLRPDVVWFGELLDTAQLQVAEQASEDCALMLVVGTSGLVYPAAGLPAQAKRAGARVLIVNPQPSELDHLADACLRGGAAVVLPALLALRLAV